MFSRENINLVFSVFKNQITSLFFILLLVSALVSFYVGEFLNASVILAIVFINLTLGFFQEFKASRASSKLLSLIQPKSYVIREGKLVSINTSDIVESDVLHLVPGSIAPVDIEVIEGEGVFVDDSVRTGETKSKEVKMGDRVFAGTLVQNGKLVGSALSSVKNSSLSSYRKKLESLDKWNSFSLFTSRVIKYVFIISLVFLLFSMFVLVFIMHKYSLAHFFIFAIAMLVGVVPEVLPLIVTIILTRESLSLSKQNILVKKLSSLESLGAIKFLLVDKTGTITENKLKVFYVSDQGEFWEISNSITQGDYERSPMDSAYDDALNASVGKIKTASLEIMNFIPFNHQHGYQTFILKDGSKIARGIAARILELCNTKDKKLFNKALEYEEKGMRVVALAKSLAGEWTYQGFVAFHDPIKTSAKDSIKLAHKQGIGVKILTGDSKEVSLNVAEELHLINSSENVISLENIKIEDLSNRALSRAIVFAKCTPENKLALMDRFLQMGPVAFLGDGINDALALKRADVGIAVDNASDIAKESADIILLEKDLSPILKSVGAGRKSLRNILTYIMYTLSGNAGTFFSLTVASFFYPVLPMLPIQILLNNLLTDLPLMLIITDNGDEYSMRHVPHFQPRKVLQRVLVFGLISSFFDLIYFTLYRGVSVEEFQTGWFVFSVLTELALILSIRSSRFIFKSPAMSVPLSFAVIISLFLPFVFVYNTFFAHVFNFATLPFNTVAFLFYITLIYIAFNEIAKYFMRKRNLYNKPFFNISLFKN